MSSTVSRDLSERSAVVSTSSPVRSGTLANVPQVTAYAKRCTLMGGIIKSNLKRMDARIHLTRSDMTASHGIGLTRWWIRGSTQPELPLIDVLEWVARVAGFKVLSSIRGD